MKLLIISGTPKTEGICHSFVEIAKETATKVGFEVDELRLADEKLVSCQMCNDGWGTCSSDHSCVLSAKDSFHSLWERVKAADAYVYITPVYWGDISEGMKIFIDRLRRVEATKSWSKQNATSIMKGKPSILVANAGGGGNGALSALGILENAVSHMGGGDWPRETAGILDMITVNAQNYKYKLKTLAAAIETMHAALKTKKD